MKDWKAVVLMVVLSLLPAVGAGAQDFPKGPVTYMNPFNPGGEVDFAARSMQPYLEKNLAQPFVINYVPGAGGGLCWSKLTAVKPDGYTIGGFSIPHIILQPIFMKDVSYKTDDFVIFSIVVAFIAKMLLVSGLESPSLARLPQSDWQRGIPDTGWYATCLADASAE